ncbi:ribonuclease Z [Hydrogenimonas sp.]
MFATFTFLGTSAGVPTKTRNVSALAMRLEGRKKWSLFDCGEGTQHRLMHTALSPFHLANIFITHLHGDHVYGLFGLMASRGMARATEPLTIYGPEGLAEMVGTVLRLSQLNLPFDYEVVTLKEGEIYPFEGFTLQPVPLSHSLPTFGFVLRFDDRPGHFDAARAKTLGIPEGPLFGRLKKGETITLPDGRSIDGTTLLGPVTKGPTVAIGGDNDDPTLFAPFAPYDLMIHEATYTQHDFDNLPRKFQHTTAKQLGEAAQEMGVKRMIFTHISPRYDRPEKVEKLKEEIAARFDGEVVAAEDFMEVTT